MAATGPDPDRHGTGPLAAPEFLLDLFRNSLDPGYADAAARRGAQPTRRRWGGRLLSLGALVVIGALLAVSYQHVVREEPTRAQVRAELVEQIHQQNATTAALEQRADDLRGEVARLRDRQLGGPEARLLRDLEAAAGLARVHGAGVVVRVADGPEHDPVTGAPVAEARIADFDLQQIANVLWALGAEAIAINDRRLTSTSTIRNVSDAILVNRLPVVGPYEVVAIGPEDLAEQFATSRTALTLQALVEMHGISYEVRAETNLTVPAALNPELHHVAPAAGAPPGGD